MKDYAIISSSGQCETSRGGRLADLGKTGALTGLRIAPGLGIGSA